MSNTVNASSIIARLQNELAATLTRAVIAEERADQAERKLAERPAAEPDAFADLPEPSWDRVEQGGSDPE